MMSLNSEARDSLKLLAAGVLGAVVLCVLVVVLGVALFFPHRSPPREAQVIGNFEAHRAAFERLRDMLVEDKDLVRVADRGVLTTKTIASRKPPAADFPLNRYNEYLSLFKEAGAAGAYRDRGNPPENVGVVVYASGFAGDTRHMNVCWLLHEPENQVSSLDDFYKTPIPRRPVYRHIEGKWYLWADW
jgi:hypothetical protein